MDHQIPEGWTPEEWASFEEKIADKHWRINNLYTIKNKAGKEIPFVMNSDQEYFFLNRHNKNVILKARQRGFTTLQCISYLDDCLFTANLSAGIIAHKVEDAAEIFEDKIKFAYENFCNDYPYLAAHISADTDNTGKLKFSNGSSIRVSTSFRSGTIQRLHISEYGKIAADFPKKAKEIRTGAFNAVEMNQEITVESTAEGMEGEFYNLWGKAEANQGKKLTVLDFKPFFFPWWKAEEYRLDPLGVEIPQKLKVYFQSLKDEHGIDLDDYQKAWYAKKYEEQGEDMPQEYPSFSEEAFVVAGRPVFDRDTIAAAIKRAKDVPFEQGQFIGGKFIKDDKGPYKLFKRPIHGKRYANGADVAEGLEDGDFSTMFLMDKNLEQVASYHNHTHPALFGEEMKLLGHMYNEALLAPEVNNHGLTTLTNIMMPDQSGKVYKFLYTRKVLDERTNEYTDKAGWQTNAKTKPLMLDELILAFCGLGDYKECPLKIYDVALLREMLALKYEPDGTVSLNGKDRVVSACIALQAVKQLPSSDLGSFESAGEIVRFKSLKQMLTHSQDSEESYFD
jgi:hypothetical protein